MFKLYQYVVFVDLFMVFQNADVVVLTTESYSMQPATDSYATVWALCLSILVQKCHRSLV
jgi:hypothetical protein